MYFSHQVGLMEYYYVLLDLCGRMIDWDEAEQERLPFLYRRETLHKIENQIISLSSKLTYTPSQARS